MLLAPSASRVQQVRKVLQASKVLLAPLAFKAFKALLVFKVQRALQAFKGPLVQWELAALRALLVRLGP